MNFFLHLERTETASETRETVKGDKIDPGKPHTDTTTTSKEDNPDDDQNSAKDATKEDYQSKTESLSSDDPPAKDNSDDEDFELGTSSLDNDEDEESDKIFAEGVKGRIKVRFKKFFIDQTLQTCNKNT